MLIRTPRLILREFTADDWRAMHAYQQDPAYLRFYDRERVDEDDARALVGAFVGWQAEEPRARVQLAVTRAETGEVIGNVGLRRESADAPLADMGYELAPAHWGRGYATEAARALLDWGFVQGRLARVHAHCIAENAASAGVLRKLGFREEGRLRAHQWIRGQPHDVLLFGILRDEWDRG